MEEEFEQPITVGETNLEPPIVMDEDFESPIQLETVNNTGKQSAVIAEQTTWLEEVNTPSASSTCVVGSFREKNQIPTVGR